MICKYCGDEFEQKPRGTKEYCDKIECMRKAHREHQKKYIAKKKRQKAYLLRKEKQNANVVYSQKDRESHKLDMPDTGDILELARQLGSLRYQLVQKVQKEYETINNYNKLDQDFLHKLENLEQLTEDEAIKLVIQEKKNRESRRVYKVRYYLIKCLLDSMPIKNPSMFITQVIQRSKDYEYVPKAIGELKEDEMFYTKKESE